MSYHTPETIAKSLESYRQAFGKLFAISPGLTIAGSGNTVLEPMRSGEVRPAYGLSKSLIPHATSVSCRMSELFEYGRPRLFGERTFVWNSSFFCVTFYVDTEWTAYHQEPESRYHDDDGHLEIEPAHLSERNQALRLVVEGKSWGLKDWKQSAEEIAHYFDGAPSPVSAEYINQVNRTNAEVDKWLAAMNSLAVTL